MRRLLLAVALAVAGLVITAPAAFAHASLESTEPAAGAILSSAPREVVLRFTEPVRADRDAIRLFDATGAQLETGALTQPEGRVVVVALPGLDDGGYAVAWKVISADGHPIGGAFTWRVGEGSTAVDPGVVRQVLDDQTASRAVGVTFGVVRFAVFAGLLVLAGGLFFTAVLWPAGGARPAARRLLWAAWAATLAGTLLGIGLQGADVGGLGVLDALRPSVFTDVLDTTVGKVWLLRALLLVPVAGLLANVRHAGQRWWQAGAAVLGIVLVATPAFSGHADSGRWIEVAKALDVTHVAAAAVWLGGVAMLLVAGLRSGVDPGDARTLAERFSAVALGAVIVVVATGTGQSIRQITTLDQLETAYGRLLAVKVVLVLGLVGVASLTRSALRGRLPLDDGVDADTDTGDAGASPVSPSAQIGIVRRLVAAELVVALAVVGVTALLVDADPGYAVTRAAGPFDETRVVGDVLVNVVVVPGEVGPTDVHLYVDDPAGGLEPPVEASATFSLPARGIAGVPVPFARAGPAHWSANDVDLPIAGEWTLQVQVLLTEVDRVTATFTIPIGGSQ